MKYIITDQGEVAIGDNTYHQILAEKVKGKVIAAGHVYFIGKNKPHVYGQSFGYGMKAKPEDADTIANCKHIIEL